MPILRAPRAVLFDLDDTLFDHLHAANAALTRVHGMHDCFRERPFEGFTLSHAKHLEELHQRVIAGEVGIDEARIERFRRLFAQAGVDAGSDRLLQTAAAYRSSYLEARRPVAGARELLAALKPRVRIGVVSNNLLEEQQGKVRLCGFDGYVDALVVSEETGMPKPDPRIFGIALERLACDAADAVMVGDSWPADIAGARGAGIRAIWFNRTGQPRPEDSPEVSVIDRLTPLDHVLGLILGDRPQDREALAVPDPPCASA